MILKALYDYYQRKSEIHTPIGYELEEIDYVIVIDETGKLVDLQNLRENNKGRVFLVPKAIVRTGQKILPNLLWDNFEYITGLSKDPKRSNKARNYNQAFINKLNSLPDNIKTDKSISPLIKFYSSEFQKQLCQHPNYEECLKINGWMAFRLDGEVELISDKEIIREYQANEFLSGKYEEDDLKNVKQGICLITGNKKIIKRLHTELRIAGSDKNVKIVAIQEKQGYDSYNKERGYNAPVSIEAEANYSAALKHLLNSKNNKIKLSDITILFWSEKKTEEIDPEEIFPWVIAMQNVDKDNPDKGVEKIEKLFESIFTGKISSERTNHFYVLGLSPNAARISVRFWKAPSVEDFGQNIKKHFDDFSIVHGPKEPKYLSLYQILSATALQNKKENVPPNLAGAVIESIIDGTPYPQSLLQQCIRRIRAEQTVNRSHAAILKATLNRQNRIHKPNQKEITMSLDPNNTNVAYRMGRLFAVLEKIQEEANPGINATIRDRFYGAASSSPITVFPRLLSLKNSHLKKLNDGRKINFEKLIGEIVSEVKSFPTNLSLNEQANFAIGYYHQRQDFFTKKSDKEETVKELNNN
ncbi:type I-C CRISPR-associated protein Cas8c/Csd1 [Ignavibacterium sp.]|uniref:type I-C CRISPR-associated protein Cas8c/Csd1 n=1 Tax=Ignavibacterium sp. TaxID=2651167 RepID=UPI00307EA2BE